MLVILRRRKPRRTLSSRAGILEVVDPGAKVAEVGLGEPAGVVGELGACDEFRDVRA
jgi:hypothetical protein